MWSQGPYKMTAIIIIVNDLVVVAQSQYLDQGSWLSPFFAKKTAVLSKRSAKPTLSLKIQNNNTPEKKKKKTLIPFHSGTAVY
jgi:hypothetical protein